MEIIKLKIADIVPYDKNPRKNDGAVEAVAESIKQCGYCAPIVIDEDNVILAGHTRLKALKKLKYKECECVRRVGMTEEQKRKYRLLDNKTNELADYIFYATVNTYELLKPLKDNGIELNSIIVWNKINTGYADMNSNYKNKYEPCFYGKRKGRKLNFVGATNECTVWDIEKDRNNTLHPTQKPIALPARAIKNSSKKGEIVLDLFGGSGSTLIACEQLNRTCYMMELDPKYYDVIVKRWENFTGNKAKRINGD